MPLRPISGDKPRRRSNDVSSGCGPLAHRSLPPISLITILGVSSCFFSFTGIVDYEIPVETNSTSSAILVAITIIMTDSLNHPVVQLLRSLIDIDSTSEKELEIGIFLEKYLLGLGYTVERIAIAPGSSRHNVYAYLGQERKARVLLTSHMDTVPPHIPFSIDGDVIRGRGACDDFGPMVAQIFAIEELRAEGKLNESGGDISFLFVVGEEKGGPGMIAANDMGLEWEAGIFGEPTEGKLAQGHKGHVVFEVVARGIPWYVSP